MPETLWEKNIYIQKNLHEINMFQDIYSVILHIYKCGHLSGANKDKPKKNILVAYSEGGLAKGGGVLKGS